MRGQQPVEVKTQPEQYMTPNRPVVGEGLVVCPGCGQSFTFKVQMHNFDFDNHYVVVDLIKPRLVHECKGVQ